MRDDAGVRLIMGFQGDALAGMGMEPSKANPRGCGVLFSGDGIRIDGSYFSWSDGTGAIVSVADFRVLESTVCAMRFPPFIAVRHGTQSHPGRNEIAAFSGSGARLASARLPEGARCSFVEIEYFEPYFESLDDPSVTFGGVSAAISDEGRGVAWSPEMARPFEAVESLAATGRAAELVYSGAAAMLMGVLAGGAGRDRPDRSEREAIAEVVRYIDQNLDKPLRQEGMLGMAGMSSTKFKRLFKRCTGSSMSDYIAAQRIKRAKDLLSEGASVAQAAKAAGFGSAANFATSFKRATGATPRQWRSSSRVRALPATEETVRRIYPPTARRA